VFKTLNHSGFVVLNSKTLGHWELTYGTHNMRERIRSGWPARVGRNDPRYKGRDRFYNNNLYSYFASLKL
jgi:hypothetical protein